MHLDPLTHARAASLAADRYVSRDGSVPAKIDRQAQIHAERQRLQSAIEGVCKGISKGKSGDFARHEMNYIEGILRRDYGIFQRNTAKP